MRSTTRWLILSIVVVSGIYVLPSVIATFAGSHSMEVNTTGTLGDYSDFYTPGCGYCHEGRNVLKNFPRCTACHEYILNELNATANSRNVLAKHTPPYTPFNEQGRESEVNYACVMCHHPPKINFAGTHTRVGVVACTYCHGNSTDPGVFDTGNEGHPAKGRPNETAWVGPKLASSYDGHSNWFKGMETTDSIYSFPGENRSFSAGFYACLACHTHLEMNMKLSRPQAFNVNITINASGGVSIGGPTLNETSSKETYAQRPFGSVWS